MARPDDETLPSPTPPSATEVEAVALTDTLPHGHGNPRPVDPFGPTLRRSGPRPVPPLAGDYVLGALLAEGGFGMVVLGEHAATGQRVAVKIPHLELATNAQIVARFEREIEVIRSLVHPNVATIYDAGRLPDGRPFFAMELLEGETLDAHLSTYGRLTPQEALAILEPVCSALDAAHAHGIIHRDIKPSNVFLARDPTAGADARRVVLLDFGVAKLLDVSVPSLTASRQIVGTLAYLSPEQLLAQPVDMRADIYGLGVLLFTMLVGQPPIAPAAFPVLKQLLLHGGAPRPSLQAAVSPALDEVVLRAMSRNAKDRHPSASAFLAHARGAVTSERPTVAAPPPAAGRRAVGIYLEILTDPGALDAPDPALLDDIEAILPAARARLEAEGLTSALETGMSMLFTRDRPVERHLGDAARLQILGAALALHHDLDKRPGRDPRVHLHLSAHTGEVRTNTEGTALGGDLLDLPAWTPEAPEEGVFASGAMLHGLAQGAWPAFAPCSPLVRLSAEPS